MKVKAIKQAIRIQVVDDHAVVRFGLRCIFESCPDIEVVVESGCGECAAHDYVEHQPDVVMMDLNMPGMGGMEAMRHVQAIEEQGNFNRDQFLAEVETLLGRKRKQ